MNCKLSKKWNKLFILEVKSVDQKKKKKKSLIHTKYVNYTVIAFKQWANIMGTADLGTYVSLKISDF